MHAGRKREEEEENKKKKIGRTRSGSETTETATNPEVRKPSSTASEGAEEEEKGEEWRRVKSSGKGRRAFQSSHSKISRETSCERAEGGETESQCVLRETFLPFSLFLLSFSLSFLFCFFFFC